ncbi:hypothetical protein JCM8097_007651 [Rhodosporidiobolus ruineniae]
MEIPWSCLPPLPPCTTSVSTSSLHPAASSGPPAASAVDLPISASDYLSSTPVALVPSAPTDHLISAALNLNLDDSRRAAALSELIRRINLSTNTLSFTPRPFAAFTPPAASTLASPRPGSPTRTNAQPLAGLAFSVEMEDGNDIDFQVNSQGHMSVDFAPPVVATTSIVTAPSASVEVGVVTELSFAQAREIVEEYLNVLGKLPDRLPDTVNNRIMLQEDDYDRLGRGRRPRPDEKQLRLRIAALITLNDFMVTQARKVACQRSLQFDPAKSSLITASELASTPTAQLKQHLNSLVSTAALIIAREYARFAQNMVGLEMNAFKKAGVNYQGAHVDWHEIHEDIPPQLEHIWTDLQKWIPTYEKSGPFRTHISKTVDLHLQGALNLVATYELETVYWAVKQPFIKVARGFDDIMKHPSYQNKPNFCRELYKAYEESRVEVGKHLPVTGRIALGDELDPNGSSLVRRLVWQPFMTEFFKRIVLPCVADKVEQHHLRSTNVSMQRGFSYVETHSGASGLSVYHKAVDRVEGNASALEYGRNLAAMNKLFALAVGTVRLVALPRMHYKEDGVWRIWEIENVNVSVQSRAAAVLQALHAQIIEPILNLADDLPPLSTFDQGRKPFERPAYDQHGGSPEHRSSGPQTVTADDGLAGADLFKDLLAPPPRTGASARLGQERRDAVDQERPWKPFETINDQSGYLEGLIGKVKESRRSSSNCERFSRRDLLQQVYDKDLLEKEDIETIYSLLINAVALAIVSSRPSIFSGLLGALVHGMELELADRDAAGELEIFLAALNQQYTGALLGLVLYTDRDRFIPEAEEELARLHKINTLFDLLCHDGQCVTCGKATFGSPEFYPRRNNLEDGHPQLLAWTTLGGTRVANEVIYKVTELIFGWDGGLGPGRAMIGCLMDYELHNMSLAARAADKGVTALTHKRDKYDKGGTTVFPYLVQDAIKRARRNAGEGAER